LDVLGGKNIISENVVEESIIALLQKIGYGYVENGDWIFNRKLDESIDESLLERCLLWKKKKQEKQNNCLLFLTSANGWRNCDNILVNI